MVTTVEGTNGNTSASNNTQNVANNDDDEDEEMVFKRFTETSWQEQLALLKILHEKEEENKNKEGEAHLEDGQLHFESEEHHGPKKTQNRYLVEGSELKEHYEFPKELYGKPIEEIDKLIRERDMTFCVISKRFNKQNIFRFSSTPSFFILYPWSNIRRICVQIATSHYFDILIVLTILVNCVLMAMPDSTASNQSEYVFLAIYSFEMIFKIIARGIVINSYTYLRDAWNWLDFIVIISAYATLIVEYSSTANIGNLQGIRTFRVFRILKTIAIIPGLKMLVNALLRAFRMLIEVMMLILFCLMVFALFALQIYMGVLRNKCVFDVPPYNETAAYSYAQYYNDFVKNSSNWNPQTDMVCGNVSGSLKCPTGYVCLPSIGENPNYGFTSFDHFGWAMLTSFQLITLDHWEDTYNKVLQTSGPWNVLFFIVIVFFGAFYLVNLMLAVVAMSYEQESISADEEKKREDKDKEKRKKRKEKRKGKNALKTLANDTTQTVQAVVESAVPAAKIASSSSPTQPLGKHGSHVSHQQDKGHKHIQRKPMVKMQSKDSGTGNSLESSKYNGSSKDDYTNLDDSFSNGSTVEIMRKEKIILPPIKNSLSKQESAFLNNNKGSVEDVDNIDQGVVEDLSNNEEDEKTAKETERPGRKYCAEHYPHIVIIDAPNNNIDVERHEGQLVSRNCNCCYDCCGGRLMVPWLYVQRVAYTIISEPLFDLFIIMTIVINTIFMALDHYDQPQALTDTLNIANYIFCSIFIMEAVLKITALTRHYFRNAWNIFDLVIVCASIADLSTASINGLSVIRTFRLMRVFKLAQAWGTMRLLLSIIMNTLGALGNLTLILLIVIYIFAVIGLQLFYDKYTPDKFQDGYQIRWHFKDIFHSFMMVFRVLCGEWIEPLWDCMRAADESCVAVFIPTLVIGSFIILNLFLALLLNAFASDALRDAKENAEDNKLKIALKRVVDLFCCCLKRKADSAVNAVNPNDAANSGSTMELKDKNEIEEKHAHTNGLDNGAKFTTKYSATDNSAKADSEMHIKDKDGKDANIEEINSGDAPTAPNKDESKISETQPKEGVRIYKIPIKPKPIKGKEKNKTNTKIKKDVDDIELKDEVATIKKDENKPENEEKEQIIEIHDCWPQFFVKLCFCCWGIDGTSYGETWFKFRVTLNKVVAHKVFETFILILIAGSSLTLAFEDVNLYENKPLQAALLYLNYIFAILFGLEMLLKWFAFGFKKYFTDFWCILDFTIVVISVASLVADAAGGANFSFFRALRTLRALRPLRAVSRWQGMRIVVNALMMAIPSILNVLVVILVFWLIFSIMGVQFFKGKFYSCQDANGNKLSYDLIKNKSECLANENYTWRNLPVNFDNAGMGFLALFQVGTREGWMEVMEAAIDSTDVDEQPKFENNIYYYLFFVAFIIFGAFFTLNLFIGVIIDNFNMLKKKYDGNYLDLLLTSGQRQYYNTIKKLGNKKPQKTIKRPKNTIQGVFYDISMSTKFDLCIVIVICLNMIQLAVDHYNQTQMVKDILNMLNMLFVVIFTLEAMVKITGLRWNYFYQPWNIFDFIVVILSLLGIILDDIMASIAVSPTLLRVIRVFRIGRVLRLIRAAKGIRKLLFALIISLPALFNIGLLLLLIMYIYSIVCLSSFQNIKINGALDKDVVNFKTFGNSFTTMFRLTTAAGWNDVLAALLLQPPDCNDTFYTRSDGEIVYESPGDCGTPWMAIFALTSYLLIMFIVIINMFIAVILDNFNQAHEQEEVGITDDDFEMFYVIWERYDPLATQFIKYEQLSNFVADLEAPLGINKPNEIALISFDLPIVEGDKLHCLDVLIALVKYVIGNGEDSNAKDENVEEDKNKEVFTQLQKQIEAHFEDAFPTRVHTSQVTTTMMRKKEDVAAKTLQRAWRSWKGQINMKNIATLAMQQQNQNKLNSYSHKGKGGSLLNLGLKLTTALGAFFNSARPSSSISRLSIRSTRITETRESKAYVISAFTPPTVVTLYHPDKDLDFEL